MTEDPEMRGKFVRSLLSAIAEANEHGASITANDAVAALLDSIVVMLAGAAMISTQRERRETADWLRNAVLKGMNDVSRRMDAGEELPLVLDRVRTH